MIENFIRQQIKVYSAALMLLLLSHVVAAQEMYKALMRESNKIRTSYGVQMGEPSGLSVQFFQGHFCSGGRSYSTFMVGELNFGWENLTGLARAKFEEGKIWKRGGHRIEANVLMPLITLQPGFYNIQIYGGTGLQAGTHRFGDTGNETINASGWNLIGRIESTTDLMHFGRKTVFITYYADIRLYRDFSGILKYRAPTVGVRVKMVR